MDHPHRSQLLVFTHWLHGFTMRVPTPTTVQSLKLAKRIPRFDLDQNSFVWRLLEVRLSQQNFPQTGPTVFFFLVLKDQKATSVECCNVQISSSIEKSDHHFASFGPLWDRRLGRLGGDFHVEKIQCEEASLHKAPRRERQGF